LICSRWGRLVVIATFSHADRNQTKSEIFGLQRASAKVGMYFYLCRVAIGSKTRWPVPLGLKPALNPLNVDQPVRYRARSLASAPYPVANIRRWLHLRAGT
jgi:hypothetical protein